jgi:7-carboxy-7-deazaguanine synthase
MKINEIFLSIQGEGVKTGIPTMFIRVPGCNLNCGWCDTVFARDPEAGEEMEFDDILAKVKASGVKHVCVTGGEPLLQKELLPLVKRLLDGVYFVSVETNGSLPIDDLLELDPTKVQIDMDLKCPSSGMTEHNLLDNINKLRATDQLKLVIKDDKDFQFAKKMLERHHVICPIILQPVYGKDPKWLAEKVLRSGLKALGVRVMVQLQKMIWGEKRGV